MISTWQAPRAVGTHAEELLLSFDQGRERRVLVLPAWFDEANKLRRLTVQSMRMLDAVGVDSFLPDLPGCNESLAPLEAQTLAGWRDAAQAVAQQVSATHVLAIRAGALIAPTSLPGWRYVAQNGPKTLRGMIRARTIAAREAGREESSEALMKQGRREGLVLAGWSIGAEMLRELETAEPTAGKQHAAIAQKDLGGPGLWLRAEPDDDAAQAEALAAIVASSEACA